MATFTFEAQEFDFLTVEEAENLAPSIGLLSTDAFTQYEAEPGTAGPRARIRILPDDNDSADGDRAIATQSFTMDSDGNTVESGIYTAEVDYFDERDGESTVTLLVGDNEPQAWTFDGNTTQNGVRAEENFNGTLFSVRQGDTITLIGQRDDNGPDEDGPDGAELARIEQVQFTEVVSGELNFEVVDREVQEGNNTVEVTVTRSRADVGTARASLVFGGTATNGSDYNIATTEVILTEGILEETITLSLLDDAEDEANETLTVTLEAIAGESVIGDANIFTLTIADDDEPPATPSPTPSPVNDVSTPTPSPTPSPVNDVSTPTPNPTPSPVNDVSTPTPNPSSTPSPVDDTPTTIVAGETTEGTGNEVVTGATPRADILNGTDEIDVIDALSGNDIVLAGLEDDLVRGRRGRDFIDGGAGNDQVFSGRHRDTVNGGAGDDLVDGGRGGDTIDGGAGNDTLLGGRHRDIIFGGAGNDILNGGRARDVLDGGSGNDTLDGGGGSDTLTGGAGSDIFVLSVQIGSDTITDFEVNSDRLQLDNDLTFADLDIQAVGNGTAINTLTGKALATVEAVDASLITESVFV